MLEVAAHRRHHATIGAADVPREGLTPLMRAQTEAPALAIDRQVFAASVPIGELAEINIAKNELSLSYQDHVPKRCCDTAFPRHPAATFRLNEQGSRKARIFCHPAPGIEQPSQHLERTHRRRDFFRTHGPRSHEPLYFLRAGDSLE